MRTGEIPFDIGQNEVINMFKGETFSNLVEGVGGSLLSLSSFTKRNDRSTKLGISPSV